MALEKPDTLYFATSSRHKYEDYQFLLGKYDDLRWIRLTLEEPLTLDQDLLIRRKIQMAQAHLPHLRFLVEQTNLHVDAWHPLPGNLSGVFLDTLGNGRLCQMMQTFRERSATVVTDLGYCDAGGKAGVFRGLMKGRIADEPRGDEGYGWDAIFIPDGHEQTLAEMSQEKRNTLSTRILAAIEFSRTIQKDERAEQITQNRVKLLQLITDHFNLSELRELCFLLGVDYEEVGGSVKRERVINLISYCDRHVITEQLMQNLRAMRAGVVWPNIA